MLKIARSYEEACRTFRWRIPDRYNMAFDVCDRQTMGGADGHRTALIVEAEDGSVERYTFHVLRLLSNRLANVLAAGGVGVGDPVLVSFPPSLEAAVALLAVVKMGAVAVPIPTGLGAEPLAWRLGDCGARAAVVTSGVADLLLGMEGRPEVLLVAGTAPVGAMELWGALERASDSFAPAVSDSDDPALLFYPAHACGQPRGVVHAHRALPGNLPAVEIALDFFARTGDVLWTSAEWMSFESLMWAVLPAWHHGVPVVARAGEFDPEIALALIARHGVRAAYLPPHHLDALTAFAAGRPHPIPRALASGPQPLSAALHEAVRRVFNVPVHEIWGIPETGAVAANNTSLMEIRPGSPGRAVPGVTVEAVDVVRCKQVRTGETGMLAVAPGAPGTFLGWWGAPEALAGRMANGWLPMGITGTRDLDLYLWPDSAETGAEGLVTCGGYPVSLDEVDAALAAHSLVVEAAVVSSSPGELRAFVVAAPGGFDFGGDEALAGELKGWVATRRAVHEVPRWIEFVDSLPRFADGKVKRDELTSRPPRLGAPVSDDRWLPRRK
jgi:acetyl-CoA synthetase